MHTSAHHSVGTHTSAHHSVGVEVRIQPAAVSSLLLCEFQGLDSGCQAWSKKLYLLNHLFGPPFPLIFETRFLYFVTQVGREFAILLFGLLVLALHGIPDAQLKFR